ncbi:hypothetical protein Dimus_015527, partial [Dionaea muscipula]
KDDEAKEEVAKDEVPPPKQKKRKLTKGGKTMVATGSEAETTKAVATGSDVVEAKGKEVAIEPEVNLTVASQL